MIRGIRGGEGVGEDGIGNAVLERFVRLGLYLNGGMFVIMDFGQCRAWGDRHSIFHKHGSKADNTPEYTSSQRTLNGDITSPSILINRITFHMPGPARRQDLEAT